MTEINLVMSGNISGTLVASDEILAQTFARRLHANQIYGDRNYFDGHIIQVVKILDEFNPTIEEVIAAFLHDSVEDTPMTVEIIHAIFGTRVANMVDACTGIGVNRKERNACIYNKINAYPVAAKIKVADRIANLEAAGPEHKKMYLKEKDAFFKNVAVHVDPSMQQRLERAYL